ncbi:hypothetical protein [Salinirussus salinus]|jgi:hypothetical protein|uniref:hypothetical protein n=1 Tax=Salinirussus salinus TaxID=1198300 RepID=UPI001914FAED|nr:hypothetical protein [Salinirussus salinus]
MNVEPSTEDQLGLLVYALFLVGAVLVGPLEAVLGLALYWLLARWRTAAGKPA